MAKIFLLIDLPIVVWRIVVPQRVSRPVGHGARDAGRQHGTYGVGQEPAGTRHRAAVRRVLAMVAVGAAAWAVLQTGVLRRWSGADFLACLVDPSLGGCSALDLYTASRFGERSTLRTAVDAVLSTSPWFRFGAQGLLAPHDNGWVEAFVFAGDTGALLYTAVLAVLVFAWLRHRSRFAGGLVLVLIGASVGLPALAANRVATCAWILVTLLLLSGTPHTHPIP